METGLLASLKTTKKYIILLECYFTRLKKDRINRKKGESIENTVVWMETDEVSPYQIICYNFKETFGHLCSNEIRQLKTTLER